MKNRCLFFLICALCFLMLSNCNEKTYTVESTLSVDIDNLENGYKELVSFKKASADFSSAVDYSLFNGEEHISDPVIIRDRMKKSLIKTRGAEYEKEITELVDKSSYGYFLSDKIIINNKEFEPVEIISNLKSSDTISNAIYVFQGFLDRLAIKLEELNSKNEDTIVSFILSELNSFEYQCLTDNNLSENDRIGLAVSLIIIRDNIDSVVKYAINPDDNLKSVKCTVIQRTLMTIIDIVFGLLGATGGVALGALGSPALSAILGGIGAVFGIWIANQITWWIFNCN